MTDQDNLRDRIEDALRNSGGYSWRDKAQAVIDDLVLTVETRPDWVAIESEWRNCPCCSDRVPLMSRVVGKWAKQ